MSPAYSETSECLITAGSSLIHTRNSSEPKMLLYGTPKVTGRASDNSFSQEVRFFRLLKYDVNHSKALVETPTDDKLDIKVP